MTKFEQRWVRQSLAAFAPPGDAGLSPARGEVDYLAAFATLLRESTPKAAWGLRLALWMVALAPCWLWGRLTTLSGLTLERRTALLSQLLSHRTFVVRELTTLLKFCAAMALLGEASVRARSGYDNVQPAEAVESGVRVRLPVVSVEADQRPVSVWPAADGTAIAVDLPEAPGEAS